MTHDIIFGNLKLWLFEQMMK